MESLHDDIAARATHPAHVRITARRSWLKISWTDLWRFRELARVLAVRDVKLRYRQTALGVAGVVIQPVLTAGVFTFVFGEVADLPSEGVPYFVFSYAGFLTWNVFASLLGRAAGSLVANSALVSKIYVPRLLLPLSSGLVVAFDFVIGGCILAVTMAAYGIRPSWSLLALPAWILALALLATGLGAAAAAAMVHYRDVGTALAAALQAVLYLTPVAYSSSAVPPRFRSLYELNPIATLIEGARWSLLGSPVPSADRIVAAAAVTGLCLAAGIAVFNRLERTFADVI